jgi:hypothetical protein
MPAGVVAKTAGADTAPAADAEAKPKRTRTTKKDE